MSGCSSCGGGGSSNNQQRSVDSQVKERRNNLRVLNNPNLWPDDFPKVQGTNNICVKTYVFKNSPKVDLFINYVRNNLPHIPMKVDVDNKGYKMVVLTGLGQRANEQRSNAKQNQTINSTNDLTGE